MKIFFSGMFDFNGDGHTDFLEEATGLAVIEEMIKENDLDSINLELDGFNDIIDV